MAPCVKCGGATREYWLGGVVLLRECTVCGHTIVIVDETNTLHERNRKLHRRCQQAEAKAKRRYDFATLCNAYFLNIALVSTMRGQLQLETARADAAEARLELLLAEQGD